jgi:hypothetical protein
MQLEGKIKVVGDVKTFGDNGFRKRELVITTEEQYPQHIMIEFVQDKCELLDSYRLGQNVKVSINVGGREWVNPQGETKYFNSITGWRIENIDQSASASMPPMPTEDAFEPSSDLKEDDHDDLPF